MNAKIIERGLKLAFGKNNLSNADIERMINQTYLLEYYDDKFFIYFSTEPKDYIFFSIHYKDDNKSYDYLYDAKYVPNDIFHSWRVCYRDVIKEDKRDEKEIQKVLMHTDFNRYKDELDRPPQIRRDFYTDKNYHRYLNDEWLKGEDIERRLCEPLTDELI